MGAELLELRHGFRETVGWKAALALFSGGELQELMCGLARLEPQPLWGSVGFHERVPAALRDWLEAAVFARPELWRKRLLRFVTGLYAMPRNGLRRRITVRLSSTDDLERLPHASTCSYELYLPAYPSRAVFDEKLDTAINEASGFFMS